MVNRGIKLNKLVRRDMAKVEQRNILSVRKNMTRGYHILLVTDDVQTGLC